MNKASESESCFIFHGFSGGTRPPGGGDVVIHLRFYVIFFSDFDG